MKKIIVISVIIVLAVFCAKNFLLTRVSKEVIIQAAKRQQGLHLRVKAFTFDSYDQVFIDGFEVLDNKGQETVIYVNRVVSKINPLKVHLGLRSFVDIKATGGVINLKRLNQLTIDLCQWEKGQNKRISWIYGAEGNKPDKTTRKITFSDLQVKDGKARRSFVTAPFTIQGLQGTLKTVGLKAHLEGVKGSLKIKSANIGGIIPLPNMDKELDIKKEKIDLQRLGDNKANDHLEPEMCQALTFIAFLLGGKPVVKTAN